MVNNTNRYENAQPRGTEVLRDMVRSMYLSDDAPNEQRLTAAHLHWKFYRNEHWQHNNDKLISFNYVRAFIDKVNTFFTGKKGFELNVEDLWGEVVPEEVEKALETAANYIWNKNKKKILIREILQMGSICGDSFIFMFPSKEERCIKFVLLDTRQVVPMFKDGDINQLMGYQVITPLEYNEQKYVVKVTEYTAEFVRTYFKRSTKRDAEIFNASTQEHDYGFIPVIHIKNRPAADSWNGIQDAQDIIKLNKIYNELGEDLRQIVDYYATPTTVITGGNASNLRRGIGEIWSGLPSDANVFNLTLGEDLTSGLNYTTVIKNAMHELGNVPENALGKMNHVSNTSAAAMHIMYEPLIECADEKWLSYGVGIEELTKKALELQKAFFPSHPLSGGIPEPGSEAFERYNITPVFTYGLPIDRTIQLTEADMELRNNIGSRREVMERLGKKNIPKLLEEIDADLEFTARETKALKPDVAEGKANKTGNAKENNPQEE